MKLAADESFGLRRLLSFYLKPCDLTQKSKR